VPYPTSHKINNNGCKRANRTIGAPLNDGFLMCLKYFQKKSSKTSFKFKKKSLCYFVKVCVKNLPKVCHFQSFSNPFTI
jgi:hypothetical protein